MPNPKNIEPYQFKKGYDPRRGLHGGRKKKSPALHEVLREILEMDIKKFFKMAGYQCPKQYEECPNVLAAIFIYQSATALGAKKGNSLGAANFLLDRLYGRAAQRIEISSSLTEKDLDLMSDEELKKVADGKED